MSINFLYSKDSEEIHTMYNLSDNIETSIGHETDEIIEELFFFFLLIYQKIRKINERK